MFLLDRYILHQTRELVGLCREDYEEFQHHRVLAKIMPFVEKTLSGFYFEVMRERLYSESADSRVRRSTQRAIYEVRSPAGLQRTFEQSNNHSPD